MILQRPHGVAYEPSKSWGHPFPAGCRGGHTLLKIKPDTCLCSDGTKEYRKAAKITDKINILDSKLETLSLTLPFSHSVVTLNLFNYRNMALLPNLGLKKSVASHSGRYRGYTTIIQLSQEIL